MSATTYVKYTGVGSQTDFTVPFPYLSKTHVYLSVDGVVQTAYSWLNSTTIRTNNPPTGDIKLYRTTPQNPLVSFTDGSTLVATDLNVESKQGIYIAQEALDVANDAAAISSSLIVVATTASEVALSAADSATGSASTATVQAAIATSQAADSLASADASSSSASQSAASANDPNVLIVAADLAQGGVTNVADYGSIDEPASSVGVGTSYLKTVKDNLEAIQTAPASAIITTTQAAIAVSKASESAASASSSATSATNAANSASASADSAASASTQATNSAFSAASASSSATTGITKASEASVSASAAASSATSSASSATTAETLKVAAQAAQAAAEAARDQTLTAYDQFDDRFLGNKASDPALDNDGNALVGGSLYFNSVSGSMKLYTGSAWVNAYVSGGGFATTATTISAGSGLTGGGDLTANRTIGIATGGVIAAMLASILDLGTI